MRHERLPEISPNTQHALLIHIDRKVKKVSQKVITLGQIEEQIDRRNSQLGRLSQKTKKTPQEKRDSQRIQKRLRMWGRLKNLIATSEEEVRIELLRKGGLRIISQSWEDFEKKHLTYNPQIPDYTKKFTPVERELFQEWWEVRRAQARGINGELTQKFQEGLSEEFFEKCGGVLRIITNGVKPFQPKSKPRG